MHNVARTSLLASLFCTCVVSISRTSNHGEQRLQHEPSTDLLVAFVICNETTFDARKEEFSALGLDARRVEPVYLTSEACPPRHLLASQTQYGETLGYECPNCMGTKEAGIFEAHTHAWAEIATLGRPAMVLESDWSIGRESPIAVATELSVLATRDEDYIMVGWCYEDWECDHAYILQPDAAAWLIQADVCSASVDVTDGTGLSDCPLDWLLPSLYSSGHLSLYQGPEGSDTLMPGLFGKGIIRQGYNLVSNAAKALHSECARAVAAFPDRELKRSKRAPARKD